MNKNLIIKTLAMVISFTIAAPFVKYANAEQVSTPTIVSEAGIVVDYDTGEVIYAKNATSKKFLASTTKLMTSLLFAESKEKTDLIPYTATAKSQPPYTLDNDYMKPYKKAMNVGDTLTADTVMKALLLFSANDSAYMISDSLGGDTAGFAKMMNDKAASFGLTDTHYENPNGLPVNGADVNYSTAYDLSYITKQAFENDWVREVMSMPSASITLPRDTKVTLTNRNTELGKNGNIGGKTGVTDQAGTCFAGVYERDGRKLIGVVLKCDRNNDAKRFEDMNKMMDYSYAAKEETFKSAGDEVGTVDLTYKLFGSFGPEKSITVPVKLAQDVNLYKNDINETATISLNSSNTDAWKVASEKTIPLSVNVKLYSSEVNGTAEITKGELIKANLMFYIAIVAAIAIAVILILLILKLMQNFKINKSRPRRRRR